jgi:predicted RecB family endonuclease
MIKITPFTAMAIVMGRNVTAPQMVELGDQFNDNLLWILILNMEKLSMDQLKHVKEKAIDPVVQEVVQKKIYKLTLEIEKKKKVGQIEYSKKCRFRPKQIKKKTK